MSTTITPERASATAKLEEMHDMLNARLRPASRKVFKLKQRPPLNGVALEVQLRLEPAYDVLEGGRRVIQPKRHEGGLFLTIVPQSQNPKGSFPEGDWNADSKVVALLGMPDVSGLLAAYYAVRYRNQDVPVYLRGKDATQAKSVNLFHNSAAGGGTGNTQISWNFSEEESVIRLSKSKDHAQKIALNQGEEIQLVRYLEKAIDAFNEYGY